MRTARYGPDGTRSFHNRAGRSDPVDLAKATETYFSSDLYKGLKSRHQEIRDYVKERHSWDAVGRMTRSVYAELLGIDHPIPEVA